MTLLLKNELTPSPGVNLLLVRLGVVILLVLV